MKNIRHILCECSRTAAALFVFVLAASFAGCSDESPGPEQQPHGEAMVFAGKLETEPIANSASTSRYNGTVVPNGTNIGLYGYRTGVGATQTWAAVGASTKPNVMFNRAGQMTALGVTYSPAAYWTGLAGDQYTFFAFAPREAATAASTATDDGIPSINFTVNASAALQADLIAASAINCTYGDADDADWSRVILPFRHSTTRVRFSVAFMAGAVPTYDVKIISATISDAKTSGKLSMATSYTNQAFSWSDLSGATLCTTTPSSSYVIPYNGTSATELDMNIVAPFYMIPQDNAAVTIEMQYQVIVGASTFDRTSTFTTSTVGRWTPGKSIIYKITIQPSVATWSIEVEKWTEKAVTGITTDDDVFV